MGELHDGQEGLYISIPGKEYRLNKSHLLSSQADLLRILKNTHHLKVLKKQKRDYRLKLGKLMREMRFIIEKLQEEVPNPTIPNSIQEELKHEIVEVLEKPKRTKEETEKLDDELLKIQEKLRELNS